MHNKVLAVHRRVRHACAVTAALALALPPAAAAGEGSAPSLIYARSHAIVVGIGAYPEGFAKAPDAAARAKELAAELAGQGFQVETFYEGAAGKAAITKALAAAPLADPAVDRFVFAFTGLMRDVAPAKKGAKPETYLVPADAKRKKDVDDLKSFLPLAEAIKPFAKFGGRQALIILDGCATSAALKPLDMGAAPNAGATGVTVLSGCPEKPAALGAFTGRVTTALNGGADANGDGLVTVGEIAKAAVEGGRPGAGAWKDAGQMVFVDRRSKVPTVAIASLPVGAKVMAGGKELGTTPTQFKAAAPGEYTLEITHPGHNPERRVLKLHAGRNEPVAVNLKPLGDKDDDKKRDGKGPDTPGAPGMPGGFPGATLADPFGLAGLGIFGGGFAFPSSPGALQSTIKDEIQKREDEAAEAKSTVRAGAVVGAGVAAAAVLAAVIAGQRASAKNSDAEKETDPKKANELRVEAEDMAAGANVAYGVGGGVAGVALITFAWTLVF